MIFKAPGTIIGTFNSGVNGVGVGFDGTHLKLLLAFRVGTPDDTAKFLYKSLYLASRV
jgi:hypothetical protein